MLRPIILIGLIVAPSGVQAQRPEAPAPVRASSPGVAPLRLNTYVRPAYPPIAQNARLLGEVVLDIDIGVDGVPSGVRVLQPDPILHQAAIDAVRRWRFEPPMVNGVPATVSVPVSVTFQEAAPFSGPVSGARSASLPDDFVVAFSSNCAGPSNATPLDFNTATGTYERSAGPVTVRANVTMKPTDVEALHDLLVKSGLMSDIADLAQWPEFSSEEPDVSNSGIRISLSVGRPYFVTASDAPTPLQYLLELRMNGTGIRLFPPKSWRLLIADQPSPRDLQRQQAVREVEQFLARHVQSFDFIRDLPQSLQWCR